VYAIFSSCEWNPTQSRSTLHFQCCDGESINVLYRLTLDYQCRMHTQVRLYSRWWGEKVGGRASQWKDPVGPTQESAAQERLSILTRLKRPQKEIGRKTFGWIFQHTENQKTPKSHWGKWMSYMNENEGPSRCESWIRPPWYALLAKHKYIHPIESNCQRRCDCWSQPGFFSRGDVCMTILLELVIFSPTRQTSKAVGLTQRGETPITLESEK
jgi:hypothetical protein